MIGVEISVSAFINPAAWQLNDQAIIKLLARKMGQVMPFWYGLCLLLLALQTYAHWHEAGSIWLLSAAILWLGLILITVLVLVPINNRIAAGTPDDSWSVQHRKWDLLHRGRVVLLLAAFVLLLIGLPGTG
jgi:uncharacterized membrane protein